MCMIAHRFLSPKGNGRNIPNAVIDTAIYRHPDGYGVAWRDPDEGLVYEKFGKTASERRAFRELLKEIDRDPSIEYVAHFRYATHGPEDAAHAHPFEYTDPDPLVGTVLVFHNGIINGVNPTKKESDTEVFVRDILANLPSRWWDNSAIRELVDHMGGWSRLVLMTQAETVNLNHGAGTTDSGLWYSSDHKPYKGATNATYWSGSTDWSSYDDEGWFRDDAGDLVHRLTPKTTGVSGLPYRAVKGADIGETTYPRSNDGVWMHAGHELAALQKFDFQKEGDYPVSVLCDTCGTAGDVYIVDGKAYIDIPHKWDTGVGDDEDGSGLLPDEQEDLLPETGMSLVAVTPALTLVTGASGANYARIN